MENDSKQTSLLADNLKCLEVALRQILLPIFPTLLSGKPKIEPFSAFAFRIVLHKFFCKAERNWKQVLNRVENGLKEALFVFLWGVYIRLFWHIVTSGQAGLAVFFRC